VPLRITATGRVASLNVSRGGVPKLPVSEAFASTNGLVGDRQRDRRFHGGPTRAVSLYSLELIEALIAEGHPVSPGSLGENLTISGLAWGELKRAARLRVGEAVLELTSFAAPCKTIRGSFLGEDFTRISQKLHPGWSRLYASVLVEGRIRPGDVVEALK
jgi:MOSC domain-containing protein YiiM